MPKKPRPRERGSRVSPQSSVPALEIERAHAVETRGEAVPQATRTAGSRRAAVGQRAQAAGTGGEAVPQATQAARARRASVGQRAQTLRTRGEPALHASGQDGDAKEAPDDATPAGGRRSGRGRPSARARHVLLRELDLHRRRQVELLVVVRAHAEESDVRPRACPRSQSASVVHISGRVLDAAGQGAGSNEGRHRCYMERSTPLKRKGEETPPGVSASTPCGFAGVTRSLRMPACPRSTSTARPGSAGAFLEAPRERAQGAGCAGARRRGRAGGLGPRRGLGRSIRGRSRLRCRCRWRWRWRRSRGRRGRGGVDPASRGPSGAIEIGRVGPSVSASSESKSESESAPNRTPHPPRPPRPTNSSLKNLSARDHGMNAMASDGGWSQARFADCRGRPWLALSRSSGERAPCCSCSGRRGERGRERRGTRAREDGGFARGRTASRREPRGVSDRL